MSIIKANVKSGKWKGDWEIKFGKHTYDCEVKYKGKKLENIKRIEIIADAKMDFPYINIFTYDLKSL